MKKTNIIILLMALMSACAHCSNSPLSIKPSSESHSPKLKSSVSFDVNYLNTIISGKKLVRVIKFSSERNPPPFFEVEYINIPNNEVLADKLSLTGVSITFKSNIKDYPDQTFYLDFLKSQSVWIDKVSLSEKEISFILYFEGDEENTISADVKCTIDITKPKIPEPVCVPLEEH